MFNAKFTRVGLPRSSSGILILLVRISSASFILITRREYYFPPCSLANYVSSYHFALVLMMTCEVLSSSALHVDLRSLMFTSHGLGWTLLCIYYCCQIQVEGQHHHVLSQTPGQITASKKEGKRNSPSGSKTMSSLVV